MQCSAAYSAVLDDDVACCKGFHGSIIPLQQPVSMSLDVRCSRSILTSYKTTCESHPSITGCQAAAHQCLGNEGLFPLSTACFTSQRDPRQEESVHSQSKCRGRHLISSFLFPLLVWSVSRGCPGPTQNQITVLASSQHCQPANLPTCHMQTLLLVDATLLRYIRNIPTYPYLCSRKMEHSVGHDKVGLN